METKPASNTNRILFLVVIIIFGLLLMFSLRAYFTAFLSSIMFYVLFKGWMHKLVRQRKWKKSRAAILIIIVSFFIVLLPVAGFVLMVYNKIAPVAAHPDQLLSYLNSLDAMAYNKFNIRLLSEKNMADIQALGTSVVSSILNQGLAIFTTITMMYFFLYFMLVNFNRMEAYILLGLPFSRSKIKMFGAELKSQTFSNAIGIPLIMLIHGLLGFIIYLITGLPEPAFWGVITGFCSIIPIVGTGIVWVPAAIYFFATGQTWQGIAVISWCAIIMGSSDNVIRFMLAKRMADVHPVITVLGIIFGLEFMGFPGLIFGPLIISYFIILLRIYYAEYQTPAILRKKKQQAAVLEIGVPFIYSHKFKQEENNDEK